jgi:hypothetical protein
MSKINTWLELYKKFWISRDIEGVLSLFSQDVKYGNHFNTHPNFNSLKEEWESIKNQRNVYLNFEIFSKEGNKYTIVWELKYTNPANKEIHMKGTYLMKLNTEGKCIYFIYSGES